MGRAIVKKGTAMEVNHSQPMVPVARVTVTWNARRNLDSVVLNMAGQSIFSDFAFSLQLTL